MARQSYIDLQESQLRQLHEIIAQLDLDKLLEATKTRDTEGYLLAFKPFDDFLKDCVLGGGSDLDLKIIAQSIRVRRFPLVTYLNHYGLSLKNNPSFYLDHLDSCQFSQHSQFTLKEGKRLHRKYAELLSYLVSRYGLAFEQLFAELRRDEEAPLLSYRVLDRCRGHFILHELQQMKPEECFTQEAQEAQERLEEEQAILHEAEAERDFIDAEPQTQKRPKSLFHFNHYLSYKSAVLGAFLQALSPLGSVERVEELDQSIIPDLNERGDEKPSNALAEYFAKHRFSFPTLFSAHFFGGFGGAGALDSHYPTSALKFLRAELGFARVLYKLKLILLEASNRERAQNPISQQASTAPEAEGALSEPSSAPFCPQKMLHDLLFENYGVYYNSARREEIRALAQQRKTAIREAFFSLLDNNALDAEDRVALLTWAMRTGAVDGADSMSVPNTALSEFFYTSCGSHKLGHLRDAVQGTATIRKLREKREAIQKEIWQREMAKHRGRSVPPEQGASGGAAFTLSSLWPRGRRRGKAALDQRPLIQEDGDSRNAGTFSGLFAHRKPKENVEFNGTELEDFSGGTSYQRTGDPSSVASGFYDGSENHFH